MKQKKYINNNLVCKVSTPRKVVGKNGEVFFFFNGQYHINSKKGIEVKRKWFYYY